MPGKRKATAKRFGVLKSPRKKRVSVKDLAAAKGRGATGGAVAMAGLEGSSIEVRSHRRWRNSRFSSTANSGPVPVGHPD